MTWLEKAQVLEFDYSEVGTLLFWDALRMALREELDYQRMMHKRESRKP